MDNIWEEDEHVTDACELHREGKVRDARFAKQGFREGAEHGRPLRVQAGFTAGYRAAMPLGTEVGFLEGCLAVQAAIRKADDESTCTVRPTQQ
jgi:hypothetical protein